MPHLADQVASQGWSHPILAKTFIQLARLVNGPMKTLLPLLPLTIACYGGQSATVETPVAPEVTGSGPPLEERLRVPLPFNKACPISELGGTVTLVSVSSDHSGPTLSETSSGVLELARDGQVERIAFEANRAFQAWGYRMAVFGGSGSYELGVFPLEATFEP